MTSSEFILWLKGFTEGVHDFNITPKQWDLLKERLAEVEDKVLVLESPKYPYGAPIPCGTDTPVQRYPWGSPVTWGHVGSKVNIPSDPNITGSISIPSVWSTTSGSSATYTVTSGSSYSPSTVTYLYPNGTNVSYTTTGGPTWHSINKIENDSKEK